MLCWQSKWRYYACMIAQPDTYAKTRIKPKKWRIADIVDGRNLRVQLTAAGQSDLARTLRRTIPFSHFVGLETIR